MADICLQCQVSGRVQGVFYRRETEEQARRRGLKGWVRNKSDGGVEVMLCGEETLVMDMVDWLWEGPERAQVKEVTMEKLPWQSLANFEVR